MRLGCRRFSSDPGSVNMEQTSSSCQVKMTLSFLKGFCWFSQKPAHQLAPGSTKRISLRQKTKKQNNLGLYGGPAATSSYTQRNNPSVKNERFKRRCAAPQHFVKAITGRRPRPSTPLTLKHLAFFFLGLFVVFKKSNPPFQPPKKHARIGPRIKQKQRNYALIPCGTCSGTSYTSSDCDRV